MSELQPDEGMEATVDAVEDIQPETFELEIEQDGADLAPASEQAHEEKPEFNQDAANKAINKKHFQYKEEERKRLAAEEELQRLREQYEQSQVAQNVEVPPIPDPYDPDYDQKIQARDEALRQASQAEFMRQQQEQQRQQAMYQQQQQQIQQAQELADSYNKRTTDLGLDLADVEKAGDTVVQYGVSQDVAAFILQDAEGPLMTKYLAANPLELEKLAAMPPMQAAIYMDRTIRQAAGTLKPKQSKAPEPPQTLSGGGVPEDSRPNLQGAVFE